MNLEDALLQLYDLKRNKRDSHESPHKPVLLLAILDLVEAGKVSDNAIEFSDELVSAFKSYFKVVREMNDQPRIELPFYFMSGDEFWELVPRDGMPALYQPGMAGGAPSQAALREKVLHATFDADLWALIADTQSRKEMRRALLARYFSKHSDALQTLSRELVVELGGSGSDEASASADVDDSQPGKQRNGAFRKVVTKIYDFRCSACGIRVKLDNIVMVDAAHLIPFRESHNDHPSNGLALCKNHHWAMDRHLIAPCPDMRWKVSDRLDPRILDFKDIVALNGQRVIPPDEAMFHPAEESLAWREATLTGTNDP